MKAVVAQNLSKTYPQGKKAVDDLNLSLNEGEIFGFLGPNGAGKTTTVKLLNGMLAPTKGQCQVFGLDPFHQPEKVHQCAGVVTEHAQMYDHMTGLQNLSFYATLFGMSEKESRAYALVVLEKLELSHAKDQKLGTYSTGMRQRLSLARSLIHRPKILFLDEPTSGLDPKVVQNVNSMIKSLAKDDGITIFLCTHQLRYAQEICTTYGLIDDGALLAAGTLDDLRALVFAGITVTITADCFPHKELGFEMIGPQTAQYSVANETEIPGLVRRIVEAGGNVYHVSAKQLSLEDIYFALLEKRKGGKGLRD